MRHRVFFKLLGAFLLVIAAATFINDLAIRRSWEESLSEQIQTSMEEKTRLFAHRVENNRSMPVQQIVDLEAKAANARATVIDSSGKVLADSEADAAKMENHATRPEFMEALQHGKVGSSRRFSHTVGVDFLYVAVPIAGGAVRLAYPLSAIQRTTAAIRRALLWASLAAIAIATLLAALAARSLAGRLRHIVDFAERIKAGDLSARISTFGFDEIAQLGAALDSTAHQLQQSFADLENSRSELEAVLNSMQDAVLAVSVEQKVQWANGLMYHMLGGSVRIGAPLVETIRDPEVLHIIEDALQARSVRSTRSSSVIPGKVLHVTAAPMAGRGVVVVLHDLTDVERVEKTRRDFIANVSHELRTPLTSIQGYTETLLDPNTDAGQAHEFLDIIQKNATRMSRLTEDLLTLARVESGEKEFAFTAVPASQLLGDTLANFREIARVRGIEVAIEQCTERQVTADVDAIQQVLANLVDNALKYGGSGGSVLLGAKETGKTVEFYVRDLGPGIASEHLPRLFERFYRVDKARSRESGGTGLGLAIAKHIVLAHGGAIRAESRLNHGSTFYFTLPAAGFAAAPAESLRPA